MRCPDCNKFVSNEEREPDSVDLDIDDDGNVSGEVEIVNECAECGTDLRSASLDLEADSPFTAEEIEEHRKAHPGCTGFDVEADDPERTSRTEGKGRGCRTFYGVTIHATVKCQCPDEAKPEDRLEGEVELSNDIQASDMDEAC